ncbi:hypothetical protein [Streptomyces sp. NPDC055607]
MNELPHQAYADLVADSLDLAGPSGQLATHLALEPKETPVQNETDPKAASQAAEIRRPGDVAAGTPLSTLAERHTEAGLRLLSNLLPADYPHPVDRGDAGDALAALALGEAIRRTLGAQRGNGIRQALDLEASWDDVAAALDTTVPAAVNELRAWAEGQHHLFHTLRAEDPDNRIGLNREAYDEVMRWVAFGLGWGAVEARAARTEQVPRHLAAVAAAPMVDTVGELRALLEQLPDEMPFQLDDHHRALPEEEDLVHTVHPSLVAVVSGLGTPAQTKQSGLLLTQVYVPFPADPEEQAAVATRTDLPPHDGLPRAEHHLERGELRPGLKSAAKVLEDLAHLLGEVAGEFTENDKDDAALGLEAKRVAHCAERVGKLADEVEVTE